jgi:hypothetical protein
MSVDFTVITTENLYLIPNEEAGLLRSADKNLNVNCNLGAVLS